MYLILASNYLGQRYHVDLYHAQVKARLKITVLPSTLTSSRQRKEYLRNILSIHTLHVPVHLHASHCIFRACKIYFSKYLSLCNCMFLDAVVEPYTPRLPCLLILLLSYFLGQES